MSTAPTVMPATTSVTAIPFARGASAGHVQRALDVDPRRKPRFRLATVDVGERGKQDDGVRPGPVEGRGDARRVRDVEPGGTLATSDFIAGARGFASEMSAHEAAAADDENAPSGAHG